MKPNTKAGYSTGRWMCAWCGYRFEDYSDYQEHIMPGNLESECTTRNAGKGGSDGE